MKLQVGVKALIKNKDGEYLFLRRAEAMDAETGPHLDIPGGRIEVDEPLEQALAREIQEETGLSLRAVHKLLAAQDIFVNAKNLRVIRLTYVAEAEGEVALSNEHSDYTWLTIENAMRTNLDPYVREVLVMVDGV
ncbi:MAG TPA: NUDIX domain-containing protein [Candidatus Saccharibacteria bacterium]|nr:NUDIX domain-containing protein [Candidatus Saccharibacteria bacterium]